MVGASRRKQADSPDRFDLGNNFIRRGTGLPRTPPRRGADGSDIDTEEKKSDRNSRSPVDDPDYFNRKPSNEKDDDLDDPPAGIVWPSRQKAPEPMSNQFSPRE